MAVRVEGLPICAFCHDEEAWARVTTDGTDSLPVCDTCLDKADVQDRDDDEDESWPR